jgi:lipid II isoglutaminyl synthase (glutamine-hydrolysing)
MRFLAIAAAKTSSSLIKLSGAGMASSLPGKIACAIDSNLLSYLASQLSQGCIAVSGTNGKSTTSGLLASILQTSGSKVIHNRQGANLIAGITASLVESADLSGRLKADLGIFEVDEAALPLLTKQVVCKTIVVTNLFRDQLDRYGELDKTASLITEGIKANNSTAVLNADDANVCNLPCPAEKIYYGLNDLDADSAEESVIKEVSYCPHCGKEIIYENKTGAKGWHCTQCTYSRPVLDVFASEIKLLPASSKFTLNYKQEKLDIALPLPGLFNIYNALAAAAAALTMNISLPTIKDGLEVYQTLFGRSEKIKIKGRTIIIQLIKNPAGAGHAIRSFLDSKCAQAIIAINDNLADGRDISWLWDAQFELLSQTRCQFIISGQRAQDMVVRLKYAGVDGKQIDCQPLLSAALKQAIAQTPEGGTVWVLPTYTALLELQKILKGYKPEYV